MQPSAPRSTPRPTADHSRDPRHVRRTVFIAGMASLLGLGPALLAAQERDRVRDTDRDRGRGRDRAIPAGHLPPPGECRVWYDNRPAGQQPPPTSCGNARADAARNGGRVIYGGNEGRDERRRDDRGRDDRGRDDRGRDDRGRDDRGRDDRGRDDRRECDEKDRRKGECGT